MIRAGGGFSVEDSGWWAGGFVGNKKYKETSVGW